LRRDGALRIERAIDAFLDWRRLERDAHRVRSTRTGESFGSSPRTTPEASLSSLATADLRSFLARWGESSAATRSNVISVLHSFFSWAEAEDVIEADPSRKIRRPPKRKPDVYRPSLDELARVRAVALPHERPAILLMEGAGLRRSEVVGCRWADLDFVRGRVRVYRKGQHWHWLPLDPDVVTELVRSFQILQPELDEYVFAVEVEQWVSAYERKWSGVDANGLARLQAGRRSEAHPSPAASWLR
jgi:integrase